MKIRVLESNRTRINTEIQRARTASEGHGYVLTLTPAAEAEILRHHKIF